MDLVLDIDFGVAWIKLMFGVVSIFMCSFCKHHKLCMSFFPVQIPYLGKWRYHYSAMTLQIFGSCTCFLMYFSLGMPKFCPCC